MDKLDRLLEEMAETRVHLQHMRMQLDISSEKLDSLLLWQREVKTTLRVYAAAASVFGGLVGFAINLFLA